MRAKSVAIAKKKCCKLIAISQTNDSSFSLNSAVYCSFNNYASRGKSSNRMFLNNSILTFLKYVTFLVPIEILHFLKYTRVSKPLQLVIQMNVIFDKHFLYSDFVNINAPSNRTLISFLWPKTPKLSLYYNIFIVYSRRRRKQELNQGTYTYIIHSKYCIFNNLIRNKTMQKWKIYILPLTAYGSGF